MKFKKLRFQNLPMYYMKKVVIIGWLFLAVISAGASTLKSIVIQADTALSLTTFVKLAQESEALAKKNDNNWLIYYWCAFNYEMIGYLSSRSGKDAALDKAQHFLEMAAEIAPLEPEIMLLQSWVYYTRIAVAPASRAKEYTTKADEAREQAYLRDPNNPRYYFLKGAAYYYMPPAFGGGKEKAKPFFKVTVEKFESYPRKTELHPNWGLVQAQNLLKEYD